MGSELDVSADSKAQASYTPVSIWWACWAGIWTVCMASGMAYLVLHRTSPALRIRGLGLSMTAVILLHFYWASVQFGTMIGAIIPGDAEYWIMGTYLPCGIALFHAANSRFLHMVQRQKRFVQSNRHEFGNSLGPASKTGAINRFRRMDYTRKAVCLVAIVMFVQLTLTVLMWMISRKWHNTWGIPGTEVRGTEMEQKSAMGRGWEWWPSVFWQFFWSWVVAPIVLWRSRHIKDTHGWRVQTIGCAIAGLHGTPMWLIALYVPAMEPINQYWLPPQWICLSIWIMEILTILLPCWEVVRHQSLHQDTLDSITQWQASKEVSSVEVRSLGSTSTLVQSILSWRKSASVSVEDITSPQENILTMKALEQVLEHNPAPLQQFSALNDFSGENIAFLTSVIEWKQSFQNTTASWEDQFRGALRIYVDFISPHHAEFPVNISSHDLKSLDVIFEEPARILYGTRDGPDPATPFDIPGPGSHSSPFLHSSSASASRAPTDGCGPCCGPVPNTFHPIVFIRAEKSIKYLVLSNTWPKFVQKHGMMGVSPEA